MKRSDTHGSSARRKAWATSASSFILPRRGGTVLVLVVALLALIALLATTLLVISRYDLVGTAGFVIENQAEMVMPMLGDYVRSLLTRDLWGDNHIAGDNDFERYDAPMRDDPANHPWLNGTPGKVVTWDDVVSNGSGWRYLGGGDPAASGDAPRLPEGLKIRYAFLILDCNGLLNINCHRYPGYRTLWDINASEGHPEWGYFARDPNTSTDPDFTDRYVRGMGPLSQVNLQKMINATGSGESVTTIDNFFTSDDAAYGRYFDIQDEMELRFPGDAVDGSIHEAQHERLMPKTLGYSSGIRRFLTAIGSEGQFWPVRNPMSLPPYNDPPTHRDYMTLCMGWQYNAEISDTYFGFLRYHRMILNPGFVLGGRNSACDMTDWRAPAQLYGANIGRGRVQPHYSPDTTKSLNRWLDFFYKVPDTDDPTEVDGHEWHNQYTGQMWLSVALEKFLDAAGLIDEGQSQDDRRKALTQFHVNWLDATDPLDEPASFFTASNHATVPQWFNGWDKNVLGIERQAYIGEVAIWFRNTGGTIRVQDVAVELVNPYDTDLVVYADRYTSYGAAWWYKGHEYALGVGASRFLLATGRGSGQTLVIPAGQTAVVCSGTKLAMGLGALPRVWDSTMLGAANTAKLRLLAQGTSLELYRHYRHPTTLSEAYWVIDRVAGGYADAANSGIDAAFAAVQQPGVNWTVQPVVIGLYRPCGQESRASQRLTAPMALDAYKVWPGGLGARNGLEAGVNLQTEGRAPLVMVPNCALRYAGELGRLWRFGPQTSPAAAGTVLTERIEAAMADAWTACQGKPAWEVRKIFAEAEAKLRYNPFATTAEEGRDLFEFFTATGCAFDNVDSNMDGRVDEHRIAAHGGGDSDAAQKRMPWMQESSNCFPTVGRINVNTAPREVLVCLNVPDIPVDSTTLPEMLADNIIRNRPFKSVPDLLQRCRTRFSGSTVTEVGFDYFGLDGIDNHNQAVNGFKILGWKDPGKLVDDADELQYLYTLNSEVLSVRSDTFAVYFRVQILTESGKVLTERRVFSLWDRSSCYYPPVRQDGTPNADYTPPRQLGIQAFAY